MVSNKPLHGRISRLVADGDWNNLAAMHQMAKICFFFTVNYDSDHCLTLSESLLCYVLLSMFKKYIICCWI